MSSAATLATSSGVPARPTGHSSIMRRYPAPRGPLSSSLASGVIMMPGLIVLTRAPRLPQRTASAITRSELPRFANWYACRESVTWSGWRKGRPSSSSTGVVANALFCSTVSGGRRCPDCEAMTTPAPPRGDDVAELFQHEGRAIQIDFEDRGRRGLRRGDAGSVDQPGDVAQTRGRLDERVHGLARRCIDGRDAHVVSGVRQHLCRRLGIVLAQIGQQDVLADTNPPGDGLTDLTGSDDDNYAFHSDSLPDTRLRLRG